MGFVRTRIDGSGTPRYLALYNDVKGRQRSAGTFNTVAQAERAWRRAEDRISEGRLGDASRGRQKFQRYVEETWLPHHQMEARTRENYTYYLRRHILPAFGAMRLIEILPSDVREWVSELQAEGVSPAVIRSCFAVLSAIFSTAFNDQLTQLHPCRGVKTPPVAKKRRAIVTPAEFDQLHAQLPNDAARLLVELDIETGLRWGELTELRPADLDTRSRTLTVSRTVVELVAKLQPDGGRYLVKQYPKDREARVVSLNPHIADKLRAHITAHSIGRHDLLFTAALLDQQLGAEAHGGSGELGMTEPNAAGRTYRHGTITAYNMAPCRCQHCRNAYAVYRAERRAGGKDTPRAVRISAEGTGHLSRNWFRRHIWQPALAAAGLDPAIRTHDLRHAHASWMLAGGADLQTVKERLGHGRITTTEQYLHTLTGADDTALTALRTIRNTAGNTRT
jgi:site-specific recombinase XerD